MSLTGAELLARDAHDTVGRLAAARGGATEEQIAAWREEVAVLRDAVRALGAAAEGWTLALEYDLLRLEKRADVVALTDRAILVLEFKSSRRFLPEDARQAEDYALDLHDFHAGSRAHPVVPVLVATAAPDPGPPQMPLLWHGVAPVLRANAATLGAMLAAVHAAAPDPREALDGAAWLAAPYRPVPGIVEAATMLYARHGVAEIARARADAPNLTRTRGAIRRAVAAAREDGARTCVFVTGIPGAGKTLCGLDAVFGAAREHGGAAFLTGNSPLVAVLREALTRDAVAQGTARRVAEQRVSAALQNVHHFLADTATDASRVPPDRVVVFDEAQRAWDEAKARADGRFRVSRLTMSEPAHALDVMARVPGWSVVVALIGNGQEINTGEAGLAEWGRVVEASGGAWRAVAAPRALSAVDPVQRLADGPRPWLAVDPDLDLTVPMRGVRDAAVSPWVDAVLDDAPEEAARIAREADGVPFLLTRDLAAMRRFLRSEARGFRRAGLVASAGARRLRAEGLGAQLATEDTARWFLDRWPDVRASDALEVPATEYSCQGLELDLVGLCWGGDLIRGSSGGWTPRAFAGTRWNRVSGALDRAYVLNTHRVLMTRARYDTVLWVPPGDEADATRPASEMGAIAAYLLSCGARPLADGEATTAAARDPAPALL